MLISSQQIVDFVTIGYCCYEVNGQSSFQQIGKHSNSYHGLDRRYSP